MRALLMIDSYGSQVSEKIVMEINELGYDSDIFSGTRTEDEPPVSGLYLFGYDGDYYYIQGISRLECEMSCQRALASGYVDLSHYGSFELLENE